MPLNFNCTSPSYFRPAELTCPRGPYRVCCERPVVKQSKVLAQRRLVSGPFVLGPPLQLVHFGALRSLAGIKVRRRCRKLKKQNKICTQLLVAQLCARATRALASDCGKLANGTKQTDKQANKQTQTGVASSAPSWRANKWRARDWWPFAEAKLT